MSRKGSRERGCPVLCQRSTKVLSGYVFDYGLIEGLVLLGVRGGRQGLKAEGKEERLEGGGCPVLCQTSTEVLSGYVL